MRTTVLIVGAWLALALCGAWATTRTSANYGMTAETTASGGKSASALYSLNGCVGGIVGRPVAAQAALYNGYIGQLVGSVAAPGGLWSGATDLGGGWKWLTWFGLFNDSGAGWIYHNEHGWMYAVGTTTASIWFWTEDMAWLWSSDSVYSTLYRASDNAWLWYQKGTKNPRLFYNFSTGLWEPH